MRQPISAFLFGIFICGYNLLDLTEGASEVQAQCPPYHRKVEGGRCVMLTGASDRVDRALWQAFSACHNVLAT